MQREIAVREALVHLDNARLGMLAMAANEQFPMSTRRCYRRLVLRLDRLIRHFQSLPANPMN